MEKIFEVDKLIGKGTFGRVFRASDSAGSTFAVKKVQKKNLDNLSAKYLKKEIRILSEISHPNIVSYLFSFETESSVYIIQEYCAGGDVELALNTSRPLKKSVIRKWINGLISGLSYLHSNNIMHRDLKLANLLLTSKNLQIAELKLADFGFAKKMEQSVTDTQLGSPLYMAPEIFRNNNYSIKADIWSLGSALYEIFTGQALYSCTNLEELIMKHEVPVEIQENTRLPSVCKNLIQCLLQKNPEDRPDCSEIWSHEYFSEDFIENERFFEENEENYEFFDMEREVKAKEEEKDVQKSEYFEDYEENNFLLVNAEIEIAICEELICAAREWGGDKAIFKYLKAKAEKIRWFKESIKKEFGQMLEYDPVIQICLKKSEEILEFVNRIQVEPGEWKTEKPELKGFRKYIVSLVNSL